MTWGAITEFEKPWLIVCEGMGDKELIRRLLKANNLEGQFDVIESKPQGRSGIPQYLDSLMLSKSFRANVKYVLIIADNDDDPAASFAELKSGLKQLSGFGTPNQERKLVNSKDGDAPGLVVLMIPIGQPGNLETLCLDAAYAKWGRQALDTYVQAMPAKDWGIAKQSKMRMQALLAATCQPKPDTNFAHHFQVHQDYRIPLDHQCFSGLVDFLRNFDQFLEVGITDNA